MQTKKKVYYTEVRGVEYSENINLWDIKYIPAAVLDRKGLETIKFHSIISFYDRYSKYSSVHYNSFYPEFFELNIKYDTYRQEKQI